MFSVSLSERFLIQMILMSFLNERGHAQRRIRRLSTKQQQPAPVGCHRHTVQRKLREDDAPIGTLGLPHEQLPARAQPPQGCGVASRRRPPLRILTVGRSDFGAMHAVYVPPTIKSGSEIE